ncbi:MAG TPA: hypothetical protein VFN61_02210 [Acidimicrobiales bacterium]|nr:hypothetical protein [Acidimicrobiales bacterium]
MRFQELRDADGTMLVRGLHPAIAVVAGNAVARAAAISSVLSTKGCQILHTVDIDDELERAAVAVVEHHEMAVRGSRQRVGECERALQEAAEVTANAAQDTSVATADLNRFDELATRLAAAEEAYEGSVRADAEAARSLAAALGELDRILGQRHSASTSLEQARKSRDSRGVPEAVIQQAMNLQSALAKAEADKRESVQQADELSQHSRAASRDALLALEAAHTALRAGMALISSGAPSWGAGVPLPGLVASYRDRLASAVAAAQAAEAHAKGVEKAARSKLDQERKDLDALVTSGPAVVEPQTTISNWLGGDHFKRDDAVLADEAFRRFGASGAAALISTLAGRGCQVIYLTEDPDILSWAIGLPHEAGGASTISTTRNRKPALVGE